MFSSKLKSNSKISFFLFFPFLNSFQALSKFSHDMILSKTLYFQILLNLLYDIEMKKLKYLALFVET